VCFCMSMQPLPPAFVGFKNSVRVAKCPGPPPQVIKNMTFVTMRMNILTFPQWEKVAIGVGQPSDGC
jgi:hypothetical protein